MALTKAERKIVGDYVRRAADEMELRDWTLDIGHAPSDEDTDAQIRCTYGRKHATIFFAAGFRGYDADRQRQTVAHELVHCHLHAACDQVNNDLATLLGKPAETAFKTSFERSLEYGVDALADAIAKHLPHIDWGKA